MELSNKASIKDYVYLDNNSTTIMSQSALQAYIDWSNKGNASSSHAAAREAKIMIESFKHYILHAIGGIGEYEVIITSGASESNSTIMHMAISKQMDFKQVDDDNVQVSTSILCSNLEHNSILKINVNQRLLSAVNGTVLPQTLKNSLAEIEEKSEPMPAIVSVMTANNETGVINDVETLAKISHSFGLAFHTDASQSFGKLPPNLKDSAIDAITITFHKYNGPQGMGALILRKSFIKEYNYPLIAGAHGLRAGTENVAGIAAAWAGLQFHWNNRIEKNIHLQNLTDRLKNKLRHSFPCLYLSQYRDKPISPSIVFISEGEKILPNTLLLSIISHEYKLCNKKIKIYLESKGVIVSIGSACNTSSVDASHVLLAMDCNDTIVRGTLRISFGDQNTIRDVDLLAQLFNQCFAKVFGKPAIGMKI